MKMLRAVLFSLVCAVPAVSLAYWEWIDKGGRKVFSDRAPPPDVPAIKIIKQPGGPPLAGSGPVAAEAAVPAASAPARLAASAPRPEGKDKQLEEKKKQAEAAEAEKKKAHAEAVAKTRADNCARAKGAKAGFDSGARIVRTNEKGEREFLDDAARAAEVKRLERIIASDCQPLDAAAAPQ